MLALGGYKKKEYHCDVGREKPEPHPERHTHAGEAGTLVCRLRAHPPQPAGGALLPFSESSLLSPSLGIKNGIRLKIPNPNSRVSSLS